MFKHLGAPAILTLTPIREGKRYPRRNKCGDAWSHPTNVIKDKCSSEVHKTNKHVLCFNVTHLNDQELHIWLTSRAWIQDTTPTLLSKRHLNTDAVSYNIALWEYFSTTRHWTSLIFQNCRWIFNRKRFTSTPWKVPLHTCNSPSYGQGSFTFWPMDFQDFSMT